MVSPPVPLTPLAADLGRLGVVLVVAGLVGWVAGEFTLSVLVGLAVTLGWHLVELWRMHRWITSGARRPATRPVLRRGLLAEVEERIDRLQRQARKRKKRLRKVAQRFQQAAEANPDGAVILGRDDRIEWLNRATTRMLGLRQGQDHGQAITHLMHQPEFTQWLKRNVAAEAYELDSPVSEGQRLLLRQVPYGNARRMLTVRDITRLHTLEQMRREFVANVSHELRSPLTVITGYLEGMSDDVALPEAYRRPVAQMTRQSARMERIVGDLLGLSRIESDPGAAPRQVLCMADLVDAIIRDAARISDAERGMNVQVTEGLDLLADHNEIYSAFSNLVFNAVRYTPAGGRIAICWRRDDDGTGVFAVHDSGVGIEAHHIPRLTERFYRVDKARSREKGGTGLGLAIVKHVLMRHDATLEITSTPGEGSTFLCRFPADRVRSSLDDRQAPARELAVDGVPVSH